MAREANRAREMVSGAGRASGTLPSWLFGVPGRLALVTLLLATAACGTGSVRVSLPERGAVQVGTRTELVIDRFGVCWPGDRDTSAILDPVDPPAIGRMIAGYANHVRRGQSCHTQVSHGYVAVFRFDLSDLERSIVTHAALRLDRENTNLPIHVTRSYPYGTRIVRYCTLDVEIATEDVFAGSSRGTVASRPIPDGGAETYNDDGGVSFGFPVTSAVQEWALGRRPNRGFVIRSKPGALDKNEDSCTGYWFNPRLTITVVRPAP